MILFEFLKLMRVFLDYLRIEYLWHVLIMPLTNRNSITTTPSTAATQQESKTSRRGYAKRAEGLEGIMRQHGAVRERPRRGPWPPARRRPLRLSAHATGVRGPHRSSR